MTTKEMIDYLQTLPQDAQLFASVWRLDRDAETQHVIRLSNKDGNLYTDAHGQTWARISWTDNCRGDELPNPWVGTLVPEPPVMGSFDANGDLI